MTLRPERAVAERGRRLPIKQVRIDSLAREVVSGRSGRVELTNLPAGWQRCATLPSIERGADDWSASDRACALIAPLNSGYSTHGTAALGAFRGLSAMRTPFRPAR